MIPRRPFWVGLLLALGGSSCFGAARSDNAVLYWNAEIVDAIRLSRSPPPLAALLLANYQVAIFDAANGVEPRYHGWMIDARAPAGANLDAAIAGAARTVLMAQWTQITNPRDIELAYERALADIPDGAGKTAGIAWGASVAREVLAKRANCGYDRPVPGTYTSSEPGKWRETPPQFRPPVLPYWGRVAPFAMTSPSQFRAPPPHSISSKEYAEEVAYVARVGPRDGAERTEYETLCTPFWSDDLGTASPPGHWNVIAEGIARDRGLSTIECARLFALLDIAEADAGIACWESKFHYRTWRPENALREMNRKLNPYVVEHPDFIPNMPSPAFPAYPSGHSAFSAAATRVLAWFLGTDAVDFSVPSDGLPGVIHTFHRLSDARHEVGMSRVWGGIHLMSENLEGQKLGLRVADWVCAHELQPRR